MNSLKQLLTPEGENLSGAPLPEYPRPALVRDSYINLNGKWQFCVSDSIEGASFDSTITVPFPPESSLSGIGRVFDENKILCYKREFKLPEGFIKDRVLLHFGAVDQYAEVFINGKMVGEHEGGYQPFCFDITDALEEENVLTVFARDHLSTLILPYGKQCRKRGGMWYTPVSGIWQTVWLESVSQNSIESLELPTDPANIEIVAHFRGANEDGTVLLSTPDGEISADLKDGRVIFDLPDPRLWSPDDPYLYELEIKTESDCIRSYFALRSLEIKDVDGLPRLCLNGKPYFFNGLLDQGYFSDGIFTPASYKCYENDILKSKALGFNMLRKHIKIEPQMFYYLCDKLGMVVFQDMVNNGKYSFFRDTALPTVGLISRNDRRLHKNEKSRKAFLTHMEQTVEQLKNHGCICLWTIFNEGWGQFCGSDAYKKLKSLDASRFIDTASGWYRGCESDVDSRHIYFKRVKLSPSKKPMFLSEFGGYSYLVDGHIFNEGKNYGYGSCKSRKEFVTRLCDLYENEIIPLISHGLCATVYTQVSDVEDETNGIFTYDRRVDKILPEEFADIAKKLKI